MTYTSTNRTITDSTTSLSASDVGKIAQFWDGDGLSYCATISSVPSSTSAVLANDGTLPASTITIYDLTTVGVVVPGATDNGVYCTQTQIENRIGRKTLAELTDDTAGSETPSAIVVADVIDQACAEIDAALTGVYTVPLVPTPRIIQKIAVDLAVYYAMLRRFSVTEVPKQLIAAHDKAIETLEKIAKREMSLGTAYAVSSVSGKVVAPTAIVDFTDSTNQFSYF